jgi:hypothetical protein
VNSKEKQHMMLKKRVVGGNTYNDAISNPLLRGVAAARNSFCARAEM